MGPNPRWRLVFACLVLLGGRLIAAEPPPAPIAIPARNALQAAPTTPSADPVAPWTKDVRITPVSPEPDRHSIHSYYLANPESPDGRYVLFFTSTHPAGYVGEVRMRARATGTETVLAENVQTEDAHRVACQQWLSGGRRVAFHEVVDKRWRVVVVDTATHAQTLVAEDRQVGFGRPDGDLLPLYGCHWNPGKHRDLEMWDARTGQVQTALSIADVERQHGAWLQQEFRGQPTSVFFPVVSPDLQRVFFKMAAGRGGDDFMTKNASHRQGLMCLDLAARRLTWFRAKWGHPSWWPDSRHIFEVGHLIFDTDGGPQRRLSGIPNLRGSHPSVSPDGTLLVTDGLSDPAGGGPNEWGIVVADVRGGRWVLLHSFEQSRGAKSWRRNDPHPAFSVDGRRIYYNVSDGPFTRLFVAERP
jgi:Tol biopolymer transport system component